MRARLAACATLLAAACLATGGPAGGHAAALSRVTVFGDSAATAMAYDPDARRVLGRGIELRLEVAACRRVGDSSCPYDGVRPPNVIERATELGRQLGSVVVVVAGYNDYESRYAGHIDEALAVFRKAGVEHVLWATLRAQRQSYVTMNDAIVAAARRHPELRVLDWNARVRGHDDWVQADGIHLTPEGAQRMAAMVNDALVELGVAPRPVATSVVKPLAIASRALPAARRGRTYSAPLRAVGGVAPYRWRQLGKATVPGMRLTTSGRIVGVPRRAGLFRLTARLVDGSGAARSRVFLLRVR